MGQYLQPTVKHHAVERFVEPAEFDSMKRQAFGKGFLMVSASPLTRSSYFAGDDFEKLRAARNAQMAAAYDARFQFVVTPRKRGSMEQHVACPGFPLARE